MYFMELGSLMWSGKSPYHTSNNTHHTIISVSYSLTTGNIHLLSKNHVTNIYIYCCVGTLDTNTPRKDCSIR